MNALLKNQLTQLGLRPEVAPDLASWQRLLERLELLAQAPHNALMEQALALNRVVASLRELDQQDSSDFVGAVTQAAAQALGLERASVWRLDQANSAIVCQDLYLASSGQHESGQRLGFSDYPAYFSALASGEVLAADDALADPRTQEFSAHYLGPLGIGAMLDAPLRLGGRLEGVLCLEQVGPPRHWSEPEQDFARALSGLVLHAMERAARRQADALQARTRHLFDLALNSAKAVVFDLNPAADCLTLYGMGDYGGPGSVAQVPPKTMFAGMHRDDKTSLRRLLAQIQTGELDQLDFEYRIGRRGADRQWRRLQGQVEQRDALTGLPLHLVGTSIDINERKRQQTALAQLNLQLESKVAQRSHELALSEARFRAVVERAPIGIAIVGLDRRYQGVNQRLCEILGRSREQLLGRSVQELSHPEDLSFVAERSHQLAAGQTASYEAEKRYLRPDGTCVWTKVHVATVNDPQGQPQYRVAAVEDISERKLSQERIQRYAAQVSALSGRLLSAQEEERRHIGRELHDEVGQVLTAVLLSLSACQRAPEGAARLQSLGAAKKVVDAAINSVRNLSLQLRPLVLDDLGLLAALRALCQQHGQLTRSEVVFEAQCDDAAVPQPLAVVLYRVCQEALTNVARHSQASQVVVRLAQRDASLMLSVQDNGQGFEATAPRPEPHLGLLGMAERTKLYGGTLDVQSAPGQGTTVLAQLPIAPPDQART